MNSSASVQSIAGFFSRPNFRDLSFGAPASAIVDYAREVKVQLLADAFDAAYEELWNNYRSEYIYKNELLSKIVFGRHSPKTASFLSEFRVANSIADAVIFNGTSTVYEIKTEYDSLDRLRAQIEDYRKVFDYSYVVTSKSRLKAVEAITPHNVGILFLSERGAISCHTTCGTPTHLRFSDMPDLIAVAAASLDDPRRFTPQVLTYRARALDWDDMSPSLLAFQTMPQA